MVNIISTIAQAPKRALALSALVAAIVLPLGLNAYGPERSTYTIENAADKVTFNSITNNPNIGDERNFVGARENNGDNGMTNQWNANEITVQPGKSYVVRMYVHNNAKDSLNLVAEGVKAQFNMGTETAKSHEIQGTLSAANAEPKSVFDHVTLKSDRNFNLHYELGSLRYENNVNKNWKIADDNKVFSTGVPLGYDAMNGKIPGCFKYAGYLTFVVTPQFNDFTASKQVRHNGTKDWKESVDAKSGDTVEFLLKYKNDSAVRQDNVTYFDKLPKGLSYVDGSASYSFIRDGKQAVEPAKNNVTTTGVNVGSYNPGGESWLKFSAKVGQAKDLECGVNTLRNIASIKPETGGFKPKEDDASVIVKKDCVKICDTTTKQIVTVTPEQAKDSKYSDDKTKCAPEPVAETTETPDTPETPAELPKTGIGEGLSAIGGAALVMASVYYIASRRMLS